MLLVETYIKESTIPNAGIGCFAAEFIEKGRKIWELHPNMDVRCGKFHIIIKYIHNEVY